MWHDLHERRIPDASTVDTHGAFAMVMLEITARARGLARSGHAVACDSDGTFRSWVAEVAAWFAHGFLRPPRYSITRVDCFRRFTTYHESGFESATRGFADPCRELNIGDGSSIRIQGVTLATSNFNNLSLSLYRESARLPERHGGCLLGWWLDERWSQVGKVCPSADDVDIAGAIDKRHVSLKKRSGVDFLDRYSSASQVRRDKS